MKNKKNLYKKMRWHQRIQQEDEEGQAREQNDLDDSATGLDTLNKFERVAPPGALSLSLVRLSPSLARSPTTFAAFSKVHIHHQTILVLF